MQRLSFVKFVAFLMFVFIYNGSKGQEVISQTIRGVVLDKITRTPLAGANVILAGSVPARGTVVDNDGNFRLEKVPVGRVGIKVSYLGYEDVILTNLEHTSGKELVLVIEMSEKVVSAREIVITADRDKSETQNKMVSVSARGFTVEETKRFAGSSNDVGRMAANFAGVNGVNDARNDIIIRGNSPIGLLWRLEGVDIPSPNHWSSFGVTGGPVCMLNNNLLANSDFITAAFPAEYGNAISGVFDLKMRTGNNQRHEFLGQIGFNGFEADAEGPFSRKNGSSYLFSYRISTYEVMNKLGINFGTGAAIPKYQDLSFKLNFPKTRLGQFSLFGLGGTSWIEMHDSEKDTNNEKTKSLYSSGEPMNLDNGSNTAIIGLNHTWFFNKNTYLRTTLAGSYHDTRTILDTITPKTMAVVPYYRDKSSEIKYSGSIIINGKINSQNNYKAGVTYCLSVFKLSDSSYSNHRFVTSADFKGNYGLLQPFIQWQYRPIEDLAINVGLHYEYFLLNNTASLEPRIGLKWKFQPNQTLSIGYGKHSEENPATVYFIQYLLPDSIHYYKPNLNIDLIRSHHFVAGYSLSINENTYIKTEVYYQYISNAGIYGGNGMKNRTYSILNEGMNFGVGIPDTLADGGTGKNYGIEITVERFLSRGLYYLLSVSLYDSKYKGRDGVERNTVFNGNYTTNLLIGKEIVLNPKQVNKGKNQKILTIDMKTTYAGGMRYTPIDQTESIKQHAPVYIEDMAYTKKYKDYSRTDLLIGFKINGKKMTQEFQISITNLFNQQNIYMEMFNRRTGNIDQIYQLGFMLLPQYRLTF